MTFDVAATRIGFIGVGIMGRHMAGHILDAGYGMLVFTRTKQKAADLLKRGADWRDGPGAVAADSHVVITMIGGPKDVEEVYLASGGLVENSRPGTYLVDMTTSTPDLAIRVYEAAKRRNLHVLDAPVSGGEIGARKANLTIMVGGDAVDFEAVKPVLELLGNNVVHQGVAGNGQHTKMCNQIINANNITGVAEGLAYANSAGLNIDSVMDSISTGSAASFHLTSTGPKMVAGDFAPGFALHHMIKDLEIALAEAACHGLDLEGSRGALNRYRSLAAEGCQMDGIQAMYKLYRSTDSSGE